MDTLGHVMMRRTPGPTAIAIIELPRPRDKGVGGRCSAPFHSTGKERRPRKRRKTTTKTKTQERATRMQENESRWAVNVDVQAAKKDGVCDANISALPVYSGAAQAAAEKAVSRIRHASCKNEAATREIRNACRK